MNEIQAKREDLENLINHFASCAERKSIADVLFGDAERVLTNLSLRGVVEAGLPVSHALELVMLGIYLAEMGKTHLLQAQQLQ